MLFPSCIRYKGVKTPVFMPVPLNAQLFMCRFPFSTSSRLFLLSPITSLSPHSLCLLQYLPALGIMMLPLLFQFSAPLEITTAL